MSEEEIDNLKKKLNYCELEYEQNGYLSVGKFNAIKEAVNLISELQKELEYEKELRIRYERRYDLCKESKDKLQKENEELKDDKEGLANGYNDTVDKLEELRVKYNELQKENAELKEKIKEYEIGIVKE